MAGTKGHSGRKRKVVELATCGQILAAAAIPTARYLRGVIDGTIKRPSWSRIEVAKFIIDHELGKARIKAEITGAGGVPTTWQELVLLAIAVREREELAEQAEIEGEPPKIIGLSEKPPEGE